MELIEQLGSLIGLSFISGINLYATVAVVGICTKFQLIQGLPPEFHVLANDAVIFVALLLYVLEFLVDKIPGLDTLWDVIHTLIRPLGGAMLALMQVGEASPALEVVVFMLGASLASAAHVTKAGTRLIINTSPEPFSNILTSLAEDVGAIGFSYLSLAHPKVSFFLTLAFMVVIVLLFPLIFRTVRMLFSAFVFRIKCALSRETAWTASRSIPLYQDAFFDRQKEDDEKFLWTGRAYAVRMPNVARFTPVQVVITSKAIHFIFRRWFRLHSRVLPLIGLERHKCYPGTVLCKWLLRTSQGDWLLNLYQPLSKTLPHNLKAEADVPERVY